MFAWLLDLERTCAGSFLSLVEALTFLRIIMCGESVDSVQWQSASAACLRVVAAAGEEVGGSSYFLV